MRKYNLKPCPFCGGKAEVIETEGCDTLAVCTKCDVSCGFNFGGDENASSEAWNKRVEKPLPDYEGVSSLAYSANNANGLFMIVHVKFIKDLIKLLRRKRETSL